MGLRFTRVVGRVNNCVILYGVGVGVLKNPDFGLGVCRGVLKCVTPTSCDDPRFSNQIDAPGKASNCIFLFNGDTYDIARL